MTESTLELLNQISHAHTERRCYVKQIHDGYVPNSPFNAGNVRPMKVGALGKLLLRQPMFEPPTPDCPAEGLSRITERGCHAVMFSAWDPLVHSI